MILFKPFWRLWKPTVVGPGEAAPAGSLDVPPMRIKGRAFPLAKAVKAGLC